MNECTNKSKRKKKTMNTEKFEEFISQYPIFEYRILDTKDITIQERVRTICHEGYWDTGTCAYHMSGGM